MSSVATELVLIVEANGGRFLVDGEELVIRPGDAAMPLLEELRANKAAIIALLQSRTEQEANFEQEMELGLWLLDRCVFRDHSWGGVAALHLDRSRWCADHGWPKPGSRRAFVTALQAEGFAVTTDGLCYGLLLREDLAPHEHFRALTEPSKPPARVTNGEAAKRASTPARC
jgi:hypothetical protein